MAFLSGFAKRKPIEYGTVFPGSNLTDFPVLVVIDGDSDIASELSGGGGIAVTAADGTTEIPFGLYPSSDPTSGDLILRFKASPLTGASTGDVMAYLYYDAGETTVEDKAGVVSNNYGLFMPLEEDPSGSAPQMYDWVSESNVGTSNGSMTSGDLVAGQIGDSLEFDGSNDFIALDSASSTIVGSGIGAGDFTMDILVKFTSADSEEGIVGTLDSSLTSGTWYCRGSFGAVSFNQFGGGFASVNIGSANNGAWRKITFKRDATNLAGFLDGSQVGSPVSASLTFVDKTAYLAGVGTFGPQALDGGLDEFQWSTVARSDDWIEYDYESQFNNADTVTLGDEETDGGGVAVLNLLGIPLHGGAHVLTGGMV